MHSAFSHVMMKLSIERHFSLLSVCDIDKARYYALSPYHQVSALPVLWCPETRTVQGTCKPPGKEICRPGNYDLMVMAGLCSVDNDIDHSERLAMVSDSDSGVGGNEADHRIPPSTLSTRQDSSDAGEEEVAHR